MDLRSLRYFVAVVRAGSITRAAEALFVSQPSLSQAMRHLEREVGVALLDRTRRAAVPTPEGTRFYDLATKVLAEAGAASERVRRVSALEVGRLVVAASSTLAVHPLTPLMASMRAGYPGLELQILDARTPAGVLDRLRVGDAELGVTDAPLPEPGWAQYALEPEEIVLASSPARAQRLPEPLPHDQVADLDIGMAVPDLESASPVASTVSGLIGRVRVRSAHRQLLWDLVQRGVVSAFVGRFTAELVLPGLELRSLAPRLFREVAMVWRLDALSPAGEALVALACRGESELDE